MISITIMSTSTMSIAMTSATTIMMTTTTAG